MIDISQVLTQVFIMALLIFVGILSYKFKFVDNKTSDGMSSILINIVTPAVILQSYLKQQFETQLLKGLLIAFLLAIISHVIALIIGQFLVKNPNSDKQDIEKISIVFTNCGFMGIPLVQSIFGDIGVFYLTAYITVMNILTWTIGIMTVEGKKDKKFIINCFKSPTIISIFTGIALYLMRINFDTSSTPGYVISSIFSYIANLNTPLAMIIAGTTIAQANFKKAVTNRRIYFITFLKLILIPLIAVILYAALPFDKTIIGVTLIATASPTAAICTILAVRYNKEPIYASEIFAVTTALLFITLPIMMQCYNIIDKIY